MSLGPEVITVSIIICSLKIHLCWFSRQESWDHVYRGSSFKLVMDLNLISRTNHCAVRHMKMNTVTFIWIILDFWYTETCYFVVGNHVLFKKNIDFCSNIMHPNFTYHPEFLSFKFSKFRFKSFLFIIFYYILYINISHKVSFNQLFLVHTLSTLTQLSHWPAF